MPFSDIAFKIMEHRSAIKPLTDISNVTLRINAPKNFSADLRQSCLMMPNTKHMIPFKPSVLSGVGMNAVPGGHFPLPSEVAQLMSRIPPPSCFSGPFVKLNELLHLIETSELPESYAPGPPLERVLKRKRGDGGEESDEESQSGTAPPVNDIYRARQQKRTHTTQSVPNS